MSQQWFSVIGLVLNLVGVLLVVTEWWRAFFSQMRGLLARLLQLLDNTRAFVAPVNKIEQLLDEAEELKRELTSLLPRTRFVIAGISMIVLGILSQIVGAWPGGIPALNILASGASG
jgi:hypothetical protein